MIDGNIWSSCNNSRDGDFRCWVKGQWRGELFAISDSAHQKLSGGVIKKNPWSDPLSRGEPTNTLLLLNPPENENLPPSGIENHTKK